MRVLFVYPEAYLSVGIPGGIAILSAVLKQKGHEVDLFDTCFLKTQKHFNALEIHRNVHGGGGTGDKGGISTHIPTEYTIEDLVANDPIIESYENEFQNKIDLFRPDVIALSTMTSTFDFTISLIKGVKHNALVVVGGVHATIAYNDCLAQSCIDYAFVGEGDNIFPEFLEKIEKGEDPTTVLSLVYRLPDGTIKRNANAPRVDLNTLPTPDWGLFDERHLFRPFEGKIYKGSFYSQSRGCPMQCTYCVDPVVSEETGGHLGYFRIQRPDVTIAQLTELKEKFGATWYKFSDDTFLLPKKEHLEELALGLKPLGIKFACSVMTNTITEEKVKIVKDMGCVAMSIGVEAGNPEIRKKLKRKYSDEKLIETLGHVKNYGLKLSTFNIIGSPGETRENIFETIELNRKLKADSCNVYIMFPYPGTPIQIEGKYPIRGSDGKIMPVSMAKYLGLSKLGPDELQGLLDTFNLYLHAPKSLWPLIQLAEEQSVVGKEIHLHLHNYIIGTLAGIDLEKQFLDKKLIRILNLEAFNLENKMYFTELIKILEMNLENEKMSVVIQGLSEHILEENEFIPKPILPELQSLKQNLAQVIPN